MSNDLLSKIQAIAEAGMNASALTAQSALTEIFALCAKNLINEAVAQQSFITISNPDKELNEDQARKAITEYCQLAGWEIQGIKHCSQYFGISEDDCLAAHITKGYLDVFVSFSGRLTLSNIIDHIKRVIEHELESNMNRPGFRRDGFV